MGSALFPPICTHVCDHTNATEFIDTQQFWDPYSLPAGLRFLQGHNSGGGSGQQHSHHLHERSHERQHERPPREQPHAHGSRPCTEPPAELGIDGAWLPVTSVWTQRRPIGSGVWLYYARGCSDFAWSAGRTLLAKNRCDAAIQLQRRLMLRRAGSSTGVGAGVGAGAGAGAGAGTAGKRRDAQLFAAAGRVAEWLLVRSNLPYASHHAQIQKALAMTAGALGRNLSLPELLVECAAGLYENSPNDCREALAPEADARHPTAHLRLPRAYALSTLAGHDLLDVHNAAALRNLSHHYRLNSTASTAAAADGSGAQPTPASAAGAGPNGEHDDGARPIDTIQLWQQPQGGGKVTWTSEIWDVRNLNKPVGLQSRATLANARGTFGHLNGSDCVANREFAQCKACMGTRLERTCQRFPLVMMGHPAKEVAAKVAQHCAA